jgi:excisionase family DNA binding protein
MTTQITTELPPRVSLPQGANYLGCSEKTVRRYIASGKLRAWRIGPRMIRIDRESLLELARPIGGAV